MNSRTYRALMRHFTFGAVTLCAAAAVVISPQNVRAGEPDCTQNVIAVQNGAQHAGAMAIGDFAGTGRSDMVLIDESGGSVYLYFNNGGGSFDFVCLHGSAGCLRGRAPGQVVQGTQSTVVSDVDRDGDRDVIALGYGSLLLLRNELAETGRRGFAAAIRVAEEAYTMTAIVAADLNQDGYDDFVTANFPLTAGIWRGGPGGTIRLSEIISTDVPGDITHIAVGDIVGSPSLDIVLSIIPWDASPSDPSLLVVLEGDGSGHFERHGAIEIGPITTAIALADLNRDGKVDLVTGAASPSGAATVLESRLRSDKAPLFAPAHSISFNRSEANEIMALAVADVDGDLSSDVAVMFRTSYPPHIVQLDREGRPLVVDPVPPVGGDFNRGAIAFGSLEETDDAPDLFMLDEGHRAYVVPNSCVTRRGDMDCDQRITNFDIDPFVLALTDPADYEAQFPQCSIDNADLNGDGARNNFDIDEMIELLSQR